jgi:protein-S-isoprenylcysteine O-methyltransferase Ste14
VIWLLPFKIACLLVVLFARNKLTQCYMYLAIAGANLVKASCNKLITTGPYRYLRNPVYFWSAVMWLGIAGLFTSWWFAGFTVFIVVPVQVYRARREAKYLASKFGAKYLEYKKRTLF